MAKGMGFDAAARSVAAKSGMPMANARAVIASGARKASPAAVRKNSNLRNVSGNARTKSGNKK